MVSFPAVRQGIAHENRGDGLRAWNVESVSRTILRVSLPMTGTSMPRYGGRVLVICRFDVADPEVPEFLNQVERALELLTSCQGCVGAELARATEDVASYVLSMRFESLRAYRRAMSGIEVREHMVPLLSRARVDEHAVHECVLTASDGRSERRASVLTEGSGPIS
ncbi:antibiotic biosynthesis monooxygenase family protein [Parasphingorhabdus pacifica]